MSETQIHLPVGPITLTVSNQGMKAMKTLWNDIDTAPTEGSHILLYRPEICFVGYHTIKGWCINAPGLPIMEPPPTHWRSLPPFPPEPPNPQD